MRFMIIRKADAETEAEGETGAVPSEQLLRDMMAYNDALMKAGVMKEGLGLHASSKGARVKFRDGKPTVTDGPFAETKELIAGFSIFETKSYDEALEWVKRWPPIDGHGNVEIEIRQVYEAEDFGEYSPDIRAQEERLKALAADAADATDRPGSQAEAG